MANQDILFPLLPRNTRVDLRSDSLRVTRMEKKKRSGQVEEDEAFDSTQQARIVRYFQEERDKARRQAELPVADGENHASHAQPTQSPVANDPRKAASEHDDDDHKGVNLDTYV